MVTLPTTREPRSAPRIKSLEEGHSVEKHAFETRVPNLREAPHLHLLYHISEPPQVPLHAVVVCPPSEELKDL